jgi:PKD repeat protein
MKKIILLLILSIALFTACNKASKADIQPVATIPAKASFAVANPNGTVSEGSAMQLKNTSTNAVSYSWDFGNGSTSTEKEPSFIYNMCGNYTITLTAKDASGNTSVIKQDLTVLCIFQNPHHNPLF